MKNIVMFAAVVALGLSLVGCATSSVSETWKTPTKEGLPVRKVAVIAVEERGLVRQGFENRFVRDFAQHGQEGLVTHDLLGLLEIKADKVAAATRLREAGADSVLVVRLAGTSTRGGEIRATPERYAETITGIEDFGWYDCYSIAYMDMGTVWGNMSQKVYLECDLFDLQSSKRLWSGLTLTVVKEDADRLAKVDDLTARVVSTLRKSGMVH